MGTDSQTTNVNAARAVIAQHGKSFTLASWFLPAAVADDAAMVYRLCRAVDDAVDEANDTVEAATLLECLRRQLSGAVPASTVVASYLEVQSRLNIPPSAMTTLIGGVQSDIGQVRIESTQELLAYAYRVAGVVGRMMVGILRVKDPKAVQYAVDLGMAMQLTNICRDVLEDARRDRVYLPKDIVERHGFSSDDIIDRSVPAPRLAGVVDDILDLAETLYGRATFGLRFIPFRSRLGIFCALSLYRAIGLKLKKVHDSDPFHGRTVLTKSEKALICLKTLMSTWRLLPGIRIFARHRPLPSDGGWERLAKPCRLDRRNRPTAQDHTRGHYATAS